MISNTQKATLQINRVSPLGLVHLEDCNYP